MRRPDGRRRERGVTLVPVLLISLLMMATSASLTSTALHRYAAERARSEEGLAAHMAESGLDVGLYELQTGKDLAADGIGAASGTLAGGRFTTTVSPAFAAAGTYTLTSVGTVGTKSRRMQMVVVASTGSGFGLIGLNSLSLSGAATVDSYDSTLGTYASQVKSGHAGNKGSVASNGNITASGSGAVYGDATPGPSKKFSGNFTVTGSTAPASSPITVNPYVYTPPGKAAKAYSGSATLNSGTYQYTSFSMKAKDALTLNGTVTIYVDGAFSMAGQATITVASGATVVIHQGSGTLSIAGGGVVNTGQLPKNLQIFSASNSTVTVTGNSAFYGTVFAPNADVNRNGTADFFGSVVGKTMTLVGNGGMHYDTSLAAGGGALTFKVALVRGW